jgi:hypothetical protein
MQSGTKGKVRLLLQSRVAATNNSIVNTTTTLLPNETKVVIYSTKPRTQNKEN